MLQNMAAVLQPGILHDEMHDNKQLALSERTG